MRIQFYIALALAIALFLAVGCTSTYDACKDPNSAIEFTPRMCHASFRPEDDR